MEMLCAFWSLGFHKTSLPVSAALPPACTKLLSNVHFIHTITGRLCVMHWVVCTILYLLATTQVLFSPTAEYLACHPSNNLECTLFSKHANCITFWCDSLPCVCHTDVTPLPLECINLRAAWNKWSFYAFNANKHKSHVICNSHIV